MLLKVLEEASLLLLIMFFTSCRKAGIESTSKMTTVVSGLNTPMGIETGQRGDTWVVETENDNNDGKVLVAARNHGVLQAQEVINNLSSIKNVLSGEVDGICSFVVRQWNALCIVRRLFI